MKFLQALLACMLLSASSFAADKHPFNEVFTDSTLRLDYIFSGTSRTQHIALAYMSKTAGWYGRRGNLDKLLLGGNGQLTVVEPTSGDTIYRHSFSTLFQEWQSTEEATRVERAFENPYLIPMPKQPVRVIITLLDTHNRVTSEMQHIIDPNDILIADRSMMTQTPWKYILKSGDSRDCIDVCFVAEGFSEKEMPEFLAMCDSSIAAITAHAPYNTLIDRFNFVAVMPVSKDDGISIPKLNRWYDTALGAHYSSLYIDRYLTIPNISRLYDYCTGIPFEHFIILANTREYGGGGIFNSYTIASARSPRSKMEVIVHEFGHSFGGLGDEYYYDDMYETMYPADTEPWEPNLTTLVDFDSKWRDMLPAGTAIPTQPDGRDLTTKVGVYEGGGYQSKGVYRPVQECRMKINEVKEFCPVCQRAITRLVDYYTR
ncbi:MAG: peptidase M64 [Bacteroidaceae bacterium]|nr:peptidase M64 [Bacteroidaceae bacterium]